MSALSNAWELIKANPWKFFLGSFSAVFLTVVGIVYSDISFVHKADIDKFRADTEQTIKDLTNKINELTTQKPQ